MNKTFSGIVLHVQGKMILGFIRGEGEVEYYNSAFLIYCIYMACSTHITDAEL